MPPPHHLTPQQWDVMHLVACGLTNKAIACELGTSPTNVQYYIGKLFDKARVRGRVALVIRAIKLGWVRLDEIELDNGGYYDT